MKRITFFLSFLIGLIGIAQEYQIEIRLVDAEVGYPIGQPDVPPYYEAVSNDVGLNTIFEIHSATNYYPGYNIIPEYEDRTHWVLCNGCDINQFEEDLLAYSSVIENAFQSEVGYTSNEMYVQLLDLNNGNPIGETPEGNIITTNEELNILFENFTVFHFEQAFPGSGNPDLLRVFYLGCDCFAWELQPELDSLVEVIESTSRLGYVILDIDDNSELDFKFYPNPLENELKIETPETITSYNLFNLSGLQIVSTQTLEELNNHIPLLSSGMYLLSVTTESNRVGNYKILKK